MKKIIHECFPVPSYFISASRECFVITSHKAIYLYNRKTLTIQPILKSKTVLCAILLGTNDSILLKEKNGAYGLYNFSKKKYHGILSPKGNIQSENTTPLLLPNNLFLDYSFYSPQQQIFVSSTHEIDSAIFFPYTNMASVRCVSYDTSINKVVVIDTEKAYFYSLSLGTKADMVLSHSIENIYAYCSINSQPFVVSSYNGQITISSLIDKTTYVLDNFVESFGVYLKAIVTSVSQKYIAAIFSNRTTVYSVADFSVICTYYLQYNHFAAFCDGDTALLLGTWEKGYYVNIDLTQNKAEYTL